MRTEAHDDADGVRIWLNREEVTELLCHAERGKERIALELCVFSGLRANEAVSVRAKDVTSTTAGPRVAVWDSKGKPFRQTPTTRYILGRAETVAEFQGPETELVPHHRVWINRRLDRITDRLANGGDAMWRKVTPTDLRRTWATLLMKHMDDPLLVMEFGGWENIETFFNHYWGTYSTGKQRRELQKVPWIDAARAGAERDPELSMLDADAD